MVGRLLRGWLSARNPAAVRGRKTPLVLLVVLAAGAAALWPGRATQRSTAQAPLTVSIASFGAVPDGITDDTVALKNALASLSATGGTLLIPTGTYLLSTATSHPSPVVPANVSLRGTNAVFKAMDSGYQFLDVAGSNVTNSGITFDGAGLASRGLTIDAGAHNVSITNTVVENIGQSTSMPNAMPIGIRIEGSTSDIIIDGVTVRQITARNSDTSPPSLVARGILISQGAGTSKSSNDIIRNSSFSDTGPKDDGDCIVIQDTAAPANLQILNNTFTRCATRAIKLQVPGVLVANNTISNPFTGQSDNPCVLCLPGTAPYGMYAAISAYASNITLHDNSIGGGGSFYNGIELGTDPAVTLSGISVQRNNVVMGASALATGQTTSLIRAFGALAGPVLTGNTLDTAAYGIHLDGAVSNGTVCDNTITHAGTPLFGTGFSGGGLASCGPAVTPGTAPGTWSPTGGMSTSRISHTATLLQGPQGPQGPQGQQGLSGLPGGKVLVVGGIAPGGQFLASAEIYDPGSGTWSRTGSMSSVRAYHTATLLPSGKVLVAGGSAATGSVLAAAELYDPAAGTWTPVPAMTVPRLAHTATLLSGLSGGKVLVAGGIDAAGRSLSSAELYDPLANSWTTAAPMNTAHGGHTATLLHGGSVLIAGGYTASSGNSHAAAELYDPASGTWKLTGSMTGPRVAHTATLLPDGKVLVAGGASESSYLASAELYDPASDAWTGIAAMSVARLYHTASLLETGMVLVAGGNSAPSSPTATTELYDPQSGVWSASSMNTDRLYHTATLLPSGKVLVAGGASRFGILAAAELYGTAVSSSPPTIIYTGNVGTYAAGQMISIHCVAADAGGPGLVSSTCTDINGPASSFPPGLSTYVATATDAAGISAGGSVSFTVQPAAGPAQRIADPAYFAPGPLWTRLDGASASVGLTVMNPNSGPTLAAPGVNPNPDYITAVQKAQASGIAVLGYVHTSLGTRSGADLKREIDAYYRWYGVDGIFFDEASTDCKLVTPYYADLFASVKAQHGKNWVVLNPGTATPECYVSVSDVLVTFEDSYDHYLTAYAEPQWMASYPPSHFWHLVHTAPDDASMQHAVALSQQRRAGWIYVTPDGMPKPWDTLPPDPYWSDELAAVQQPATAGYFISLDPAAWHVTDSGGAGESFPCPGVAIGGCRAGNVTATAANAAGPVSLQIGIPAPPASSGGQLVSLQSYQSGTFETSLRAAPSHEAINAVFLYNFATQDEIDVEVTNNSTQHDAQGAGSGPTCGVQPATGSWQVWLTVWRAGVCREHSEFPLANPQDFHTYTLDWQASGIRFMLDGSLLQPASAPLASAGMRLVYNAWPPCWKDPVRWPQRANGSCQNAGLAGGLDPAAGAMTVKWLSYEAVAAPVGIGNLTPAVATAGGPGFTLTMDGNSFAASSVVNWAGTALTTSRISTSRLTATVPASLIASIAGGADVSTVLVTVSDSATSAASAPAPFVITAIAASAAQATLVAPGASGAVTAAAAQPGSPAVSATLTNGPGSGSGAVVTAVTYGGVPPSPAGLLSAGGYTDLQVAGASPGSSLSATFYYSSTVTPVPQLLFWDGTAWLPVAGSGGLVPSVVFAPTGSAYGGSFTVTLDGTSTPTLAQVSGTRFVVGRRDRIPPVSSAVITPTLAPNAQGWVRTPPTVTLTATDEVGGSGVASATYIATSAHSMTSQTVSGASATVPITAEGTTTLSYFAVDNAGNVEATHNLTVRYDATLPSCSATVTPGSIWPPNNKLVQVSATVTVTDEPGGSGSAGYRLLLVTSSEAGQSTDIQGSCPGCSRRAARASAARCARPGTAAVPAERTRSSSRR